MSDATRPQLRNAVLVGFILLAAAARLLPHPPNFSPVEAVALFGGAYFASRWAALAIPLLAMVLADLGLAALHGGIYADYLFGAGQLTVYGCVLAITIMGFGLRGQVNAGSVLAYGLSGSLLFFVVTNFAAWVGSSLYPPTFAGLMQSYAAGIPFFKWTVAGTFVYSAVLFGGFELLRHRVPGLSAGARAEA